VTPNVGQSYIVPAFLVVILGGLGSLVGTMIAAVLAGLVSALVPDFRRCQFQPGSGAAVRRAVSSSSGRKASSRSEAAHWTVEP
jgi:branched-subunit amino acid ABC-type transport system permease component